MKITQIEKKKYCLEYINMCHIRVYCKSNQKVLLNHIKKKWNKFKNLNQNQSQNCVKFFFKYKKVNNRMNRLCNTFCLIIKENSA
jgi:hypothetical protein